MSTSQQHLRRKRGVLPTKSRYPLLMAACVFTHKISHIEKILINNVPIEDQPQITYFRRTVTASSARCLRSTASQAPRAGHSCPRFKSIRFSVICIKNPYVQKLPDINTGLGKKEHVMLMQSGLEAARICVLGILKQRPARMHLRCHHLRSASTLKPCAEVLS